MANLLAIITDIHNNSLTNITRFIYNHIPIRYFFPLSICQIKKPSSETKIKNETFAYKLFKYRKQLRKKERKDPIEMMIQKMVLTQSMMQENRKRRTIGLLLRVLCIRIYSYIRQFIIDDQIVCDDNGDDKDDDKDDTHSKDNDKDDTQCTVDDDENQTDDDENIEWPDFD